MCLELMLRGEKLLIAIHGHAAGTLIAGSERIARGIAGSIFENGVIVKIFEGTRKLG